MANTYCDLCKRPYWNGNTTELVAPLGADGDYCEACAVAACMAVDWLAVQAVVQGEAVHIPLVEWLAVMERWMPAPHGLVHCEKQQRQGG